MPPPPAPDRLGPYAALLFDMDGTLIDSLAVAERVWGDWGERQGLDRAAFLAGIHGVRAVEVVRRHGGPGLDADAEAAEILQLEIIDVDGILPLPGAAELLAALPPGRMALVTSAPRALAEARLRAAGLPWPAVVVAAEDVAAGKPAPDPFLLAAARLGVPADRCLVVEDAPAGVAAGHAAGAAVLVVEAVHRWPELAGEHRIRDYRGLAVEAGPDGVVLVRAAAGAG